MRALITGITGQDGSYLAELLLSKGYEIFGIVRRVAIDEDVHLHRIKHILKDITLMSGTVENYQSIFTAIQKCKPDEIYHLAAQSFVTDSFKDEFTTMKINVEGTHNVLSIIKDFLPTCKFYFAGSSEMFGNAIESPQTETTPFNPCSIYGISKCCGFNITKHYRDAYKIHASSGILFNHESPRRGIEFVTKKIVNGAVKISKNQSNELVLGNINARRDWGHAKDYVRAMHLMLQQDIPDDYVIATGVTHSIHDFCNMTFSKLGLNCDDYIKISDEFKRPSDVNLLIGNYSKAKNKLNWEPSINLESLIDEMIHDVL